MFDCIGARDAYDDRGMDRNGISKHRKSLSVRAERAFGLESAVTISGQKPGLSASSPAAKTEAASALAREAATPAPALNTVAPARVVARQAVVNLSEQSPPVPACALPLGFDAVPFAAPILPADEKRIVLQQLDATEVKACPKCRLCETRTNTVFGEGDVDAKIFFIGEGPGESEDLSGRPFVGRAGQLLTKMIEAMGLRREQVFIANIVKCRPPGNREPAPDEVAACTPYLLRQLEVVRPKVIVTLGKPSTQYMLRSKEAMGKMRGRWHEWRGIKLMPTYHPSYVLRSYTAEVRRTVWNDLQMVLSELGLPLPKRGEQ